jgi:hypothetical protein
MKKSKFLKINFRDVLRGAVVAGASAFVTALNVIVKSQKMPTITDLQLMAVISAAAFSGYLITNLLTNSQGNFKRE